MEWVSYDLTAAANQAEAKGLQPRAQGWLVLLLIHEQAIRLFAFFLGNPSCLSLLDILFAAGESKKRELMCLLFESPTGFKIFRFLPSPTLMLRRYVVPPRLVDRLLLTMRMLVPVVYAIDLIFC